MAVCQHFNKKYWPKKNHNNRIKTLVHVNAWGLLSLICPFLHHQCCSVWLRHQQAWISLSMQRQESLRPCLCSLAREYLKGQSENYSSSVYTDLSSFSAVLGWGLRNIDILLTPVYFFCLQVFVSFWCFLFFSPEEDLGVFFLYLVFKVFLEHVSDLGSLHWTGLFELYKFHSKI